MKAIQRRLRQTLMFAVITCLTSLGLFAQEVQVTGKVTSSDGEPLPGVSIILKGTTTGSISDLDGNYQITAPSESSVLSFSFIGFLNEEREVGTQSTIDVQLTPDLVSLEDVVVVGYTTQNKKDFTGAIGVVDIEELGEVPYANVLQGLQGRVAGVSIAQDGQPGSGRTQIRIRGVTTLNNNNPLYVVDGIPTTESLDNINPNDIESIQVLKDASAASIYGSRSASGVVVITTKKGKSGKLSVDAGAVLGTQTLVNRVEVLNAQEWGELYWQAADYSGRTANLALYGGLVPTPQVVTTPFEVPDIYNSGESYTTYTFSEEGTNWADEVYRQAKNNQYYVNINAGSEKGSYAMGLSYKDQDGIINHTFHKRITGRVNSDYKFNDWIKVEENLSVSWSDQVQTATQDAQSGIPYQVIRQHPALPVYDDNGNYAGGNITVADLAFPNAANPVSSLDRGKDNNSISYRIFGNAYIELNPFKALSQFDGHDLVLKSNVGVDYSNYLTRNYAYAYREGGFSNDETGFSREYGVGQTLTWINTAEYKYKSGRNDFKLMAGHEAVAYEFSNLWAGRRGYEVEDLDYIQIGSGEVSTSYNGGGAEDWGLLSYFGRADYIFANKYLAAATLRYDRTSRFDYSGYFPAVSLGWKIDQEEFAQPLFAGNWVSSLKIRGSWGQQGNQMSASAYPMYSTFGTNPDRADYDLNGDNTSVNTGMVVSQIGTPDLRWEITNQTNIGIDMTTLKNSLQVTFDYFYKRTDDILAERERIAAEGGGSNPIENTASIENSGFELNLSHFLNKPEREFQLSTSFQISHYKNTVVSLGDRVGAEGYDGEFYMSPAGESIVRYATGQPFASFYGWKTDGIFQTEDEVTAHAEQDGKAVGRIKYQDISGPDDVPDGVVDDLDRTYLGSPNPDLTMGLNIDANWKNFNLAMFFYSQIGQEVYNYTKQNTDFFEPNFNVGTRILDAWTPENTSSSIPAAQLTATNDERRASDYFVEDASFLKLRSIKLGYTLPKKITKDVKISIYGEVQNVFTWTGYTGIDPEVPYAGESNVMGVDKGFYPLPRMVMFGINMRL